MSNDPSKRSDSPGEQLAHNTTTRAARRGPRPIEVVLLVLLAISLLIHALTITQLLRVRTTLREQIAQLATSVVTAKGQTLRYSLPVDQQIPIDVDIPIQRAMAIPIQTEVRIQQNINVPVDTGVAGTIVIPIPLDVTVPISTTVPIEFNQTVNVSTTVPLQLDVPIALDLGTPQFAGYLDRLRDALLALRDQL